MILALDPSLSATGWALISGWNVFDCGVVITEKGRHIKTRLKEAEDFSERTVAVFNKINEIIESYNKLHAVMELPHAARSKTNCAWLGFTWALCGYIKHRGINVTCVSPFEIKKLAAQVTGKDGKDKSHVRQMVLTKFENHEHIARKDHNIIDACAAYCAANAYKWVSFGSEIG